MPATNIYLPLQFNQLVDLIKSLPEKEKQQLYDLLQEEQIVTIPEWQKEEVNRRIKKYDKHPELLIEENEALKIINDL
jgi:hypothetical protein